MISVSREAVLPQLDSHRVRLSWRDRQRFAIVRGGLLDVLRCRLNSCFAVSHAGHPFGDDGIAISVVARHEPCRESRVDERISEAMSDERRDVLGDERCLVDHECLPPSHISRRILREEVPISD